LYLEIATRDLFVAMRGLARCQFEEQTSAFHQAHIVASLAASIVLAGTAGATVSSWCMTQAPEVRAELAVLSRLRREAPH
jgi:hypothetical protein